MGIFCPRLWLLGILISITTEPQGLAQEDPRAKEIMHKSEEKLRGTTVVPYTHLTLPKTKEVDNLCAAVRLKKKDTYHRRKRI